MNIVYLDTETTGLNPVSDQIIELAYIIVSDDKVVCEEDILINSPESLPDTIVRITGLTDAILELDGISLWKALKDFSEKVLSLEGEVALVAYNAQFDLTFLKNSLMECLPGAWERLRGKCVFIDAMTVYKDRALYPHKLENAIGHYKLSDKCHNSHRAIDDTFALRLVCEAMEAEKDDFELYYDCFGFNPKYGITGDEIEGVIYRAQEVRKE